MSGFDNQIIGGQEVLARSGMRSAGYVAGAAGWRIGRDGSAEFNAGTFRGDLLIGDPTQAWVEVTHNIPAELVTYYNAHWAVASFRAFVQFGLSGSGVEYYYLIAGRAISGTFALFACGWVDNTATVFEARVDELNAGAISTIIGNVSPAQLVFGAAGNLVMNNGSTVTLKDSGNVTQASMNGQTGTVYQQGYERKYNGRSMPRGLAWAVQLSGAPVATSTAGAEVALLSSGNFTYRAGRAYKVSIHGPVTSTAVLQYQIRVRRNNSLTGTPVVIWTQEKYSGTGDDEVGYWAIFNVGAAADVTDNLLFTLQGQAAGNVSFSATGGAQGQIHVEDIGVASDFPGFITIT